MTVKHDARVWKLELQMVRTICENIGSVRALTVDLLIKYEEWDQLLALEISADHYDDHSAFADDYLVTAILSKNPRVPTSEDPHENAIRKFLEAETKCAETNARLTRYREGQDSPDPDVDRVLHYARRRIACILGPLTRSKLSFAERNMRFGPGATTSLSGVVTQGKKYSRPTIDATPRVLPLRAFAFPHQWGGVVSDINVRLSSKMRVVPKKATCGRTICIEPDLNIFVQLGFGALIRRQLANYGLDLNTQANNQALARKGSLTDGLCTMDLSSASDLISREVVWELLPYDWADALHFSRVDYVERDNVDHRLEKWSSMGNGYTFELETLLFYGILLGVAEETGSWDDIIAYGDDLIFPSENEDLVRRTLNYLGFSVNARKTFGKGNFRESCGTDWFRGHNVRPFFLKADHHDFDSICYVYANLTRRYANRTMCGLACDSRFLPAWLRCVTAVPPSRRFRIPEGFGDVGFISNWDESSPSLVVGKRRRGWCGYTFRYWSVKAQSRYISQTGSYISFLSGNISDFARGLESLRGRWSLPQKRMGHSLEWPHLGPWL